mgnify:CR=1 FL=1
MPSDNTTPLSALRPPETAKIQRVDASDLRTTPFVTEVPASLKDVPAIVLRLCPLEKLVKQTQFLHQNF